MPLRKGTIMEDILYYPCVFRCKTGLIDRIVGEAMTKDAAERYLKIHYRMLWIKGDAIPQLKTKMDKKLAERKAHENKEMRMD